MWVFYLRSFSKLIIHHFYLHVILFPNLTIFPIATTNLYSKYLWQMRRSRRFCTSTVALQRKINLQNEWCVRFQWWILYWNKYILNITQIYYMSIVNAFWCMYNKDLNPWVTHMLHTYFSLYFRPSDTISEKKMWKLLTLQRNDNTDATGVINTGNITPSYAEGNTLRQSWQMTNHFQSRHYE